MRRGGVVAGWIALTRRRWRWGLGVGAVVLGLAALLVLPARPVYRAEARLRLGEAPPAPGVSPAGNILGFFRMGGDPFANDLEVLASRTLAERVTEAVALNVRVVAPKGWHRDSLFTAVRGSRDDLKRSYHLAWEEDGAVAVTVGDTAVGRFTAGEPIRLAGVELVPGPRRPGAPTEVTVSVIPFGEAVKQTGSRVVVERTRREANVVSIRFDDTDPRVAEAAVRAAVDGFITVRTGLFERESAETVDSLRGVAERTRAELTAAEAAAVALQRSNFLVAPDAQSQAAVERFADAQAELEIARQELAAINTMLARAQDADAQGSSWTALVSHPRFLENETMGSLLTRLTVLEQERTALAARRSQQSVEYRTLIDQMRFLESTLLSVASAYKTGLTDRIGPLEELVARIRGELASVPDQALELARKQREVRLLGEIFLLTEQRLRQEELREALTFSNVQVIDPPQLEFRPIWPRKKLGLAVGMMLALGFAVLAMVVVESADSTVRSARELSTVAGAPVLAALAVNGRVTPPAASETAALLTVGGSFDTPYPPLVVVAVDGNGGTLAADEVRAALTAGGGEPAGSAREVRIGPPVTSYAAARAALAQGGPVLLAVVRGRTSLPDVERAVRLLREAGGAVAGMVVVCRSEQEAGELWS